MGREFSVTCRLSLQEFGGFQRNRQKTNLSISEYLRLVLLWPGRSSNGDKTVFGIDSDTSHKIYNEINRQAVNLDQCTKALNSLMKKIRHECYADVRETQRIIRALEKINLEYHNSLAPFLDAKPFIEGD